MATAGDGRAACASGGARDEFRKRLFQPEINEDPQNVYQEAGQNSTGASEVSTKQGGNLGSISVTVGKSEHEHMLEQTTYTRSEAERLIELVHSRIMEESPSPLTRLAASTSRSLKRHKHGDERDKVETQGLIASLHSRVVGEQLASPAELPKHPATMENLPNELLLNIFIRLLAKQLAQMRSVSKSWNALLSQSTFIKSHLHRSNHTNDQILLVFNRVSSNFKPFTAHPCQSPHLELTNFIKLPVNPQPECTHGIRVIGAVNGLICSSYGDSSLQIWNPSLSAVLTLPPYSNPSCDDNLIKIGFRFGLPKTEDYKVVKLMCYGGRYYAVKRWLQVEVFSMRKGLWELIPQRFPSHVTGIRDNEVVCVDDPDGHLHWLGCHGRSY